MFKKAQIEMMGLLIIVILIVVGVFFYVSFVLNKPSEIPKTNVESIQARNLMNAVMNIQICENVTMKEAVVLCDRNELLCNEDSCRYIEENINNIVGDLIKKQYAFVVERNGEKMDITVGECDFGVNSPSYLFSESGIEYQAYFKLC